MKIICKTHGIFEQEPRHHTTGEGCPFCKKSKGEKFIKKYLTLKNINYISQKTFDGCKNIKQLYFDFYLPDYNTCIEYDGEFHFKSIKYFGGDERLKQQQKRDNIKNIYCKDKNINLYRIKYNENIEEKLNDFLNDYKV